MAKKIDSFRGEYRFLSNFYTSPIFVEKWGEFVPTVEHAYQSLKASTKEEARPILMAKTPGAAKAIGSTLNKPADWLDKSLGYMEACLRLKFAPGTRLAHELLATGDAELEEGNEWGDTFWGVYKGQGQNHLGKILMKIRGDLAALTSNP